MESASPTIFDPYHKWLGIRGFRNAPNHYRLLGIDLFENDEEVIRDAAARQLTHLKTYRVGAQRELCSRIIDEVTQARSVLLDRERKTEYDRELKLKSATSGPVNVNTTNGPSLISDLDTVGGDMQPGSVGSLHGIAAARSIGRLGPVAPDAWRRTRGRVPRVWDREPSVAPVLLRLWRAVVGAVPEMHEAERGAREALRRLRRQLAGLGSTSQRRAQGPVRPGCVAGREPPACGSNRFAFGFESAGPLGARQVRRAAARHTGPAAFRHGAGRPGARRGIGAQARAFDGI